MILPTLAVTLGLLAAAAPANAGIVQSLGETLTGTVAKQTNASTSILGPDLQTTAANLVSALKPVADPSCAAASVSKPFLPWKDSANYVLAPGGSFEAGLAGWTTDGTASITSDNEPWNVSGNRGDASSVTLARGTTITSGGFCGGAEYPTVRLFARAATGTLATAAVTIRFTGRDGLLYALPLGVITAGKSWQPTPSTLTLSGLPLLTGTRLGVSFTSITGSIALDDVYVDPFRRN
jgi:hypothetical protein